MTFSQLLSLQKPRQPPLSWAEVEARVRALDGAALGLLTLGMEGAEGYLTVQGGPSVYALTAYFPGRGRFRYCDSYAASDEVLIYDDGLLRDWANRRHICNDLTRVLGIVQRFWEYGELHPAMRWEKE
jgi:hypothetical protein